MKKIATDRFSLKTKVKCSWRFLIYKLSLFGRFGYLLPYSYLLEILALGC